jgi:hypothetical protein
LKLLLPREEERDALPCRLKVSGRIGFVEWLDTRRLFTVKGIAEDEMLCRSDEY